MLPIFFALLAVACASVAAEPKCALVPPASTVASASASSPSSGSFAEDDVVATTWFAGWHADVFKPEFLSFSKYTHITYAFAVTTPVVSVVAITDQDKVTLPKFVELAHQNGVKALISVGGWTGSQYFSPAVATAENRTLFVKTLLDFAKKYQLDGLDFDWEYPNSQGGMSCNMKNPADTENFLTFLEELKPKAKAVNLVISAAVAIKPFNGPDGNPLANVAKFAGVFDWISIMSHDIWGSFTEGGVGPNAPLNDTCSTGSPQGSAVSAVTDWTNAGFPANQIVLGVASYGRSYLVAPSAALEASTKKLKESPVYDKKLQPAGDAWDGGAGVDQCGDKSDTPGGIFNFWGLVSGGFLKDDGTAAPGVEYRFDECSQTPYVWNPQTQVMVSFDDAKSFAAKGKFIDAKGLRGFAMWESAGDHNDILIDSISEAIGIESVCEA